MANSTESIGKNWGRFDKPRCYFGCMEPVSLIAILCVGIFAGTIGSLFGIGGGLITIPIMTLFFGLSAMDAAAASLVGIVATSLGGTKFYLENKVTNIRVGLFLEISTVIGAISGALIAGYLQEWAIMGIFALVMIISGVRMYTAKTPDIGDTVRTEPEKSEFVYRDMKRDFEIGYNLHNKYKGFAICSLAGVISSITGVGGGVIKVPIMNIVMNVPIKAAMATSSYMIGITAFSGAIVYLLTGNMLLDVAAFLAVGSFIGSLIGVNLSKRFESKSLKKYFGIMVIIISIVMFLQAGGVL